MPFLLLISLARGISGFISIFKEPTLILFSYFIYIDIFNFLLSFPFTVFGFNLLFLSFSFGRYIEN